MLGVPLSVNFADMYLVSCFSLTDLMPRNSGAEFHPAWSPYPVSTFILAKTIRTSLNCRAIKFTGLAYQETTAHENGRLLYLFIKWKIVGLDANVHQLFAKLVVLTSHISCTFTSWSRDSLASFNWPPSVYPRNTYLGHSVRLKPTFGVGATEWYLIEYLRVVRCLIQLKPARTAPILTIPWC